MERELQAMLDWWAAQGVEVPDLPKSQSKPQSRSQSRSQSRPEPVPANAKPVGAETEVEPAPGLETAPSGDPEALAASARTLDQLKAVLDGFDAGALTAGARQAVFARGDPAARIMIVGEAPGRDEDRHGKPFVGRSGQLLDKMMGAIGLAESGFYVTNVVNWRPEKNRTPTQAEIRLCQPFLFRHIELQDPDILLLTGNVPLKALTGETGIMRQRGHWRDVEVGGRTRAALPIYHPAFLLRQPALKKDAWRDLLSLRARLDGA